jgi:hypothetical protein
VNATTRREMVAFSPHRTVEPVGASHSGPSGRRFTQSRYRYGGRTCGEMCDHLHVRGTGARIVARTTVKPSIDIESACAAHLCSRNTTAK